MLGRSLTYFFPAVSYWEQRRIRLSTRGFFVEIPVSKDLVCLLPWMPDMLYYKPILRRVVTPYMLYLRDSNQNDESKIINQARYSHFTRL